MRAWLLRANRQREVAYSYQTEFCPPELLPGFSLHQTDRDPSMVQRAICSLGRCANASRRRDFDLLGYRYSLLSAVATGGLNNVVNMLPARDTREFDAFPAVDVQFFQRWLRWTDQQAALLRRTRALPGKLGRPAAGRADGVSMVDEHCSGFLFLINPTARPQPVSLPITAALTGTQTPGCTGDGFLLISQLGSSDRGEQPARWDRQLVQKGKELNLSIPATTVLVLELTPLSSITHGPRLLGAPGNASYDSTKQALSLSGVRGEAGAGALLQVLLPSSGAEPAASVPVRSVVVNGRPFSAFKPATLYGRFAVVNVRGRWAGQLFRRAQEVGSLATPTHPVWRQRFHVPSAVIEQLHARNRSYTLDPYDLDPRGNDESGVPWLSPGRLLLFVKYRPLVNDSFNVSGDVDGTALLFRKAYNTIVPHAARFIGWWADVTQQVRPGHEQTLSLQLPPPANWTVHTGALSAGNDVKVLSAATVRDARRLCAVRSDCTGLTFQRPAGVSCAATLSAPSKAKIYLKSSSSGSTNPAWCTMLKPATFEGVHFDNVETIYTNQLEGTSDELRM